MLLLVTNRDDLTADWLVRELERRGTPFARFNSEDYPTATALRWTPSGASIELGGRRLASGDVDGVWWRRPLPPAMPAARPGAETRWSAREALAALDGFWRTLEAHWVNPPDANLAAECKPEQLRRAADRGFDVPATLVSNDVEAARAFLREHGAVVCKPLRDGRVPAAGGEGHFFTSPLRAEALEDADAFGPEPYLLQARVPKRYDVRVTVIGDEAFACRIESQGAAENAVDWRVAEPERLPHAVEDLPPALAARCVALTRSYGLRFAAIDLACRPDGGYTFFELNPNGQWAWVEQLTGLPLRARLADELLGGTA